MQRYNVPKVKESKGIQILTTIWLVPFLAMIIALWLAFQYYTKIGPTIKISFKSNVGLIANQSQIKMRDVTVGMITKISLSDDGKGVIVQAEMNKEVASYLNNKAKFWIVHPDVGSHGVSGLDTLLSGSYIKIYGVKDEYTKRQFIGLEKPYIDKEAEGTYYLLSAPKSYNISEGSNVYYRMIKVGRVERVGIAPNGEKINFTVFVDNQYAQYVNKKSKFYAQSSLSLDFSKGKLDMQIASISHLVHGGVSIYTPIQTLKEKKEYKIAKGDVFPLYKSLNQLKSKQLINGEESQIYIFIFKNSQHELEIGSPIEFQGFQVGYVTDIENHFTNNKQIIESKIYALLYTSAFKNKNDSNGSSAIKRLVSKGLKAKLNKTLPLIGAEYIDLVFNNKIKAKLKKIGKYTSLPTLRKDKSSDIISEVKELIIKLKKLPLEKLLNATTALIDNNNKPIKKVLTDLDKVIVKSGKPIEKILKDLEKIMKNIDKTVQNLNILTTNENLQQLPENIQYTLQELDNTLIELQNFTKGYDSNSQFSAELSATLQELSLASESISRISRKLERKPNALLLGDD
ncbi:Paraquat-inducible protein B [hydrothermal vent metagenome]|uniref:Paraquat-inducible protein B n=1 Tax=hydrothermal vent metagenome TaxID=652676 RepID=A0A1W1CQH5_9ZZZZ